MVIRSIFNYKSGSLGILLVATLSIAISLIGVNEFIVGVVTLVNSYYGTIYGGNPVIIETKNGKIRGFESSWYATSRDGRKFYEFLGIPFAEPPVGKLRFEPSVPVKSWTHVRDASYYAPKCLQFDPLIQVASGSEDCLYLNVYSPKLKTELENPKLPVLVFIHGGLFMFGRAELFRPDYLMDEDVVLVTIHYRLGALGFLNTGDKQVRGNMGLKDQILALKWIKNNIEIFGGDSNSVTLIGESAGGASIHYHMMSHHAKDLFHKAITMSGSSLSHWALVNEPAKQAEIFAAKLDCPYNNTREMVRCLKRVDADRIVPLCKEADDRLGPRHAVFVPTVERYRDSSTYLNAPSRDLLRDGKIVNKVPWLNGVNSDEGLIYAFSILLNETCIEKLNSDWSTYAPILFDYENIEENERNKISDKIRNFYIGQNNKLVLGTESIQKIVPLFSDLSFNLWLIETVNSHHNLSHDPMYLYYYSYKSEHAIAQVYFNLSGYLPLALDGLIMNGYRWILRNILQWEEEHYGVSHADELIMLFQFPYVLGRVSPQSRDYNFSKKFIKTWVSFARNGKPGIEEMPHWPKVESNESLKFMKIDEEYKLIDNPFGSKIKFWKDLFHFKKLNI